jgi:hypothetical protein
MAIALMALIRMVRVISTPSGATNVGFWFTRTGLGCLERRCEKF